MTVEGLIFLALVGVFVFFPSVRCFFVNIHKAFYYVFADLISYFRTKGWRKFKLFGIRMFIGMFGHGKTLSMTHVARGLYKKYGDSLIFYSNYALKNIPYVPLVNFNQLVDLGEVMPDGVQGYVVLIDEISSVLSHRNYASFPLELIGLLCQQRKKHVYIMCSAQRFFMVDKIWRSITTTVTNCNKYWRFQHLVDYDAWELENAMNSGLLKRTGNSWWFVTNKDFNSYDTSEMISKSSASDFISNEDSIIRKGLDSNVVNDLAVERPSRRLKKLWKKGK